MTERDDTVSRRYRELPMEEPPRALDEAILAASRRAVESRPAPLVAPAGRQRWYVPLAAAAVIVLAVGLTLRIQLERPEVTEEVVTPPEPTVLKTPLPKDEAKAGPKLEDKAAEKPAEAPAVPAPERRARQMAAPSNRAEAPSPFPDERAREAPSAPSDTRSAEAQSMRGSAGTLAEPPAAAAPSPSIPPLPAPKAAPQPLPQVQMRAAPAQAPRADDASRDRAERALASGALAKKQQEAEETPEKALERIAELRKAGKHDEADKALAEFRKRYPDYKLSDEMKAKVERR